MTTTILDIDRNPTHRGDSLGPSNPREPRLAGNTWYWSALPSEPHHGYRLDHAGDLSAITIGENGYWSEAKFNGKPPKPATIKITLSERRPVTIVKDHWELIASADWFSGQHECQANEVAFIRVRQHADKRTIVYCSRCRGPGGMPAGYTRAAGGFLLDLYAVPAAEREEQLLRAVRRCAGIVDLDKLGDECIADLPAEDI